MVCIECYAYPILLLFLSYVWVPIIDVLKSIPWFKETYDSYFPRKKKIDSIPVFTKKESNAKDGNGTAVQEKEAN